MSANRDQAHGIGQAMVNWQKAQQKAALHRSLGRDDGKGAHPTDRIADTLAARDVLWKVRR
jgi:hypothetical protein